MPEREMALAMAHEFCLMNPASTPEDVVHRAKHYLAFLSAKTARKTPEIFSLSQLKNPAHK